MTANREENSMTDLNKRIAIIAGWKWQTCRGYGASEHWHAPEGNCRYFVPPRFLSPENLHFLVELANKKFESYEMYKYSDGLFWVRFRPLGATDKSFNWSGKPVTSLSAALAAALAAASIEAAE